LAPATKSQRSQTKPAVQCVYGAQRRRWATAESLRWAPTAGRQKIEYKVLNHITGMW